MTTINKDISQVENAKRGATSFRHALEVESFYRFIHDNNLRRESKLLINAVLNRISSLTKRKKGRPPKKIH